MSRALGPRPPLAAGNAALAWMLIVSSGAWPAWPGWRGPPPGSPPPLAGGRVPPFGMRWVIGPAARPHRAGVARRTPTPPGRRRPAPSWPLSWPPPAVTAWRIIARRITQPGDPVAALSRDRSIRQLAAVPAAEQGIRLRPSLAGARPGRLAPADIGLLLGRLKQPGGDGPDLYASWEDTLIAFMGPRSARPPALGIPYVLSAPGPVVATSVKADLWAATAELRAASGSRDLGVRPAAHHRRRAAVWVEPAGRADQRRGSAPAGRPLRAHHRRRAPRRTSGGRPRRNC